jgi:cob(I)alamin adenosyltransferase
MEIYTGTGDRGKTSLFSGQRVSKANERIEAHGDMDELNSIIGHNAGFAFHGCSRRHRPGAHQISGKKSDPGAI